VETKDKSKEAQQGREGREGREGEGGSREGAEGEELYAPSSPSLHLEEGDPFAQASRLFLKEFDSKREALFSNSARYSLSKEESLSPLPKKTKYL